MAGMLRCRCHMGMTRRHGWRLCLKREFVRRDACICCRSSAVVAMRGFVLALRYPFRTSSLEESKLDGMQKTDALNASFEYVPIWVS